MHQTKQKENSPSTQAGPLECKDAFGESTEGIYLRTRSDRNLFKLSRLRAKARVHKEYVRDFLFADDAAITTHTQEDLQWPLDRFSEACRHFGLTISLAKTHVMGQDIKEIPSLFIYNYKLEVIHEFVYLRSTITDNLSIDNEVNKRIGKAAMTLYCPTSSFQRIPKSMYIKPV